MVTDKLKVPFRKLKHIHHISDIQIRNLKRHREYEQVFEGLYKEVKKNPKNGISYIGGDINIVKQRCHLSWLTSYQGCLRTWRIYVH